MDPTTLSVTDLTQRPGNLPKARLMTRLVAFPDFAISGNWGMAAERHPTVLRRSSATALALLSARWLSVRDGYFG